MIVNRFTMSIATRHFKKRQSGLTVRNAGERGQVMSEIDVARIAKALSHPVRIRLLLQLCSSDVTQAKELVTIFDLAQSTVSEHLRILREAGLVAVRREGSRKLYYARASALIAFANQIDGLVCACQLPEGI